MVLPAHRSGRSAFSALSCQPQSAVNQFANSPTVAYSGRTDVVVATAGHAGDFACQGACRSRHLLRMRAISVRAPRCSSGGPHLADRMFPFLSRSFGAIGIVSVVKDRTDVAVVALINPNDNAFQLTGFNETIIVGPPRTTVASAKFYTTPGTSLIIPGHNIYFVRLSSPVVAAEPPHLTSTTFNFSWDKLYNCVASKMPAPHLQAES